VAAALLLASLVSTSGATAYSGRATGATVKLVNPGPNILVFADTGDLPPQGGSLSATLLTIQLQNTLSSHTITASTSGGSGVANSSASQENVVAFPGQPAQVTASVVRADSHADCSGASGSSVVTDLTFGGSSVTVTGQPNQTVVIANVATLIINEQITVPNSIDITVNALHLILGTGEEVILSTAHSDVVCSTPSARATWGMLKALYR
jgi:hypothetical protein